MLRFLVIPLRYYQRLETWRFAATTLKIPLPSLFPLLELACVCNAVQPVSAPPHSGWQVSHPPPGRAAGFLIQRSIEFSISIAQVLVCADDGKALLVFKLDVLKHLDGWERTTNKHVLSLPVYSGMTCFVGWGMISYFVHWGFLPLLVQDSSFCWLWILSQSFALAKKFLHLPKQYSYLLK